MKDDEGGPQARVPLTDGDLDDLCLWQSGAELDDTAERLIRLVVAELRRLRERESRLERAAEEVHGMSECRYMEPLWENYTAHPCEECVETARRMAIKADGLEDLT